MYPNPAYENLIIENEMTDANMILYDILGNEVMNLKLIDKKNNIDISGLSPGMYLGQIINENQTNSFKVVVK